MKIAPHFEVPPGLKEKIEKVKANGASGTLVKKLLDELEKTIKEVHAMNMAPQQVQEAQETIEQLIKKLDVLD